VNELPNGWAMTTISDITKYLSRGKQPKYTSYSSLPVINQRAIRWFGIQSEYLKYVDPAQFDQWEPERFIQSGDILWNSTGTGTLGRACLIAQSDLEPPKVVDSHVTIVRPNQSVVDPRFLFSWIQSSEVQENIASLATGATNQIELSRATISSMRIPIAPLKEQKEIADKLDLLLARVDACRDRLDRVSHILDLFRQSVLLLAMSGELTEDWRQASHQSAEWQNILLSEICTSITDGTHQPPPQTDSGIPFITIAAINDGHLRVDKATRFVSPSYFEQLQASRQPEFGDILFSVTGSIAIPALVDVNEPFVFQRHIAILKPDSSQIISKFLLYSLRTVHLKKQAQAVATGTAQRTIPLSGLRAFVIELPSIDEQQEIVRHLEVLFAYADRLEARYQNAYTQVEQLVPMLLSKAFRGELVPQDPDDEPVSVLLERIRVEKALLEAERKTTRIVRRPTKQAPRKMMKQLPDYSEALRSAFIATGREANARQLFDQAGFSPEEVVQFYEALRITPELRTAFEITVGEHPQQQSLRLNDTDRNTATNGRFRLVELWLEDFKNLSDYTVHFNPTHGIAIVLGWNGTGKSNLLEALVIIFRDLHRWWDKNQWTDKPMKGYRLRYEIDRKTIEVIWQPAEMKRPKLRMGTIEDGVEEPEIFENITRKELPLPKFIFGYYSGPTNRLAEHFLPMKRNHYDRLLKATSDNPETLTQLLEQRRFFCAENHHAKYVLLAFCHKEDPAISQFLEDRLRIVGFESALFIIREPAWAKKGQDAESFWGAEGVMRRVMERLQRFAIAPMVVEQTVNDGYRSKRENHYYFFLPNLQSLHAFAAEYQNARSFFLALESTDFSELIYDLKIQVRVKATHTKQVAITFHELSEGEQQLLMVLGLMRFTKSHQSLVLLDEPDTHLNPHWSVDYLKLLTRVMSESDDESEEQQTSQILMSTHDPLVIASLFKEQIHLLKRDWETGICRWYQSTVDPRGLGFTGILTSEMFGMRSDLDEETLADLDNKVRLVAKEGSLTSEEAEELEGINKRLEDVGFQKAFSDPYYAAFVRAWGQRHSNLMAGVRFLNEEQREEIDQIAREVLEEVMAELQAEAVN